MEAKNQKQKHTESYVRNVFRKNTRSLRKTSRGHSESYE